MSRRIQPTWLVVALVCLAHSASLHAKVRAAPRTAPSAKAGRNAPPKGSLLTATARRAPHAVKILGSKRRGKTNARRRPVASPIPAPAPPTRAAASGVKQEAIILRQIALLKKNLQLMPIGGLARAEMHFRLAELFRRMYLKRWTSALDLNEKIFRAKHPKRRPRAAARPRPRRKISPRPPRR